MISEKMKGIAEVMIQGEYDRAVKEHGRFHSLHEGYAVLKEEIEETYEELARRSMGDFELWKCVRNNDNSGAIKSAETILESAIKHICEAVQVGAVAKKIMDAAANGDGRQGCGIWVRDKESGRVHEVGTDMHDSFWVTDKGVIHYNNLQNGDGCASGAEDHEMYGYEFIQSEYGYPWTSVGGGIEIDMKCTHLKEITPERFMCEKGIKACIGCKEFTFEEGDNADTITK